MGRKNFFQTPVSVLYQQRFFSMTTLIGKIYKTLYWFLCFILYTTTYTEVIKQSFAGLQTRLFFSPASHQSIHVLLELTISITHPQSDISNIHFVLYKALQKTKSSLSQAFKLDKFSLPSQSPQYTCFVEIDYQHSNPRSDISMSFLYSHIAIDSGVNRGQTSCLCFNNREEISALVTVVDVICILM